MMMRISMMSLKMIKMRKMRKMKRNKKNHNPKSMLNPISKNLKAANLRGNLEGNLMDNMVASLNIKAVNLSIREDKEENLGKIREETSIKAKESLTLTKEVTQTRTGTITIREETRIGTTTIKEVNHSTKVVINLSTNIDQYPLFKFMISKHITDDNFPKS